jgi:acetyl-CoA acetyltransferase
LRAFDSKAFCEANLGTGPVGAPPLDRVNVNGGAIALGHPVGASGGRLILSLLREMERSNVSLGLATLCIGGGQGGAVVVERS